MSQQSTNHIIIKKHIYPNVPAAGFKLSTLLLVISLRTHTILISIVASFNRCF
jgi:hypothetical protein